MTEGLSAAVDIILHIADTFSIFNPLTSTIQSETLGDIQLYKVFDILIVWTEPHSETMRWKAVELYSTVCFSMLSSL